MDELHPIPIIVEISYLLRKIRTCQEKIVDCETINATMTASGVIISDLDASIVEFNGVVEGSLVLYC